MSLPSPPTKTTLYQIRLLFMGALCWTGKLGITVSFNGQTKDFHSHRLSEEYSATRK